MNMKLLHRLPVARSSRQAGARSASTWAAAMVAVALLLGGCSGMRLVDSDVNAFATPAAQAVTLPASYRFERLPSQQVQGPQRNAMEALVEAQLARLGLRRDDAAPQYSVQVEVRSYRDPHAPWDDPRYFAGFARPFAVWTRYGTVMHYPSFTMHFELPYFRREVNLVMRRIADGQVVFESRAKHDGRWSDDEAVLPAMLQAALQGFPNPPQGLRRVVVEIPR